MATLFAHPTDPPGPDTYHVARAVVAGTALLDAGCEAWRAAPALEWGHDRYRTAFRAVWTAAALAIRFDCDDDGPWWTLTARDARLWEEEVVELFVDPAGAGVDYAELEINPANTICDLRVRTPWPALSSDRGWDWTGVASRVVPDPAARGGAGWTVCALLPFAGLATLSAEAARRIPPVPGDRWRFNVFRIKRPHGPAHPERDAIYAAWSVPAGPSFHDPSVFCTLAFAG